jgi:hypothetical protein
MANEFDKLTRDLERDKDVKGLMNGKPEDAVKNALKVDKDGSVFGGIFKVDPDFAPMVDGLTGFLQVHGYRYIEDYLAEGISRTLKKMGTDEARAPGLGKKYAGRFMFWGLVPIELYASTIKAVYDNYKATKEIGEQTGEIIAPKKNKGGYWDAINTDNEVVQASRNMVSSKFKNDLFRQMGVGSKTLMLLGIRHQQRQAKEIKDLLRRRNQDTFDFNGETLTREQLEKKDESREGTQQLFENLGGIFAGTGSNIIQKKIRTSLPGKNSPTGLKMILHLREELQHNPDRDKVADEWRMQRGGSIKDYVKEIFQQHQDDMGRKRIGERLLPQLNEAAELIANALKSGDLDAISLINLVGERKVVVNEGKYIAEPDRVEQLIRKEAKNLPPHVKVDPEKFFEESALTEDEMKEVLRKLSGVQRQFFIALHPVEPLLKLGVTREEYDKACKEIHSYFGGMVKDTVEDIAAMSADKIRSSRLVEKQVKEIKELSEKFKQAGSYEEVVKLVGEATDERGKDGIEKALRDAFSYWDGKVTSQAAKNIDKALKETETEEKVLANQNRPPAANENKPGNKIPESLVENASISAERAHTTNKTTAV